MPINPDDYRKFLAEDRLTPEYEDAVIHSVAQIMEGVLDRQMHAIERMRRQVEQAQSDSRPLKNPLHSKNTRPDKEET